MWLLLLLLKIMHSSYVVLFSSFSHFLIVSSAFARALSTLPLTGCRSRVSRIRSFRLSSRFNSVLANRFAHFSFNSNSHSTVSSPSSSALSASSSSVLKRTTRGLSSSVSLRRPRPRRPRPRLTGGGQDTNVSHRAIVFLLVVVFESSSSKSSSSSSLQRTR